MNKALTEEFIALIPTLYTQEFKTAYIGNPSMNFCNVFQQFLNLYGELDKNNRKLGKDRMKTDQYPNDRTQKLSSSIVDGIECVHFTGQPIQDADAINIGIHVTMQ